MKIKDDFFPWVIIWALAFIVLNCYFYDRHDQKLSKIVKLISEQQQIKGRVLALEQSKKGYEREIKALQQHTQLQRQIEILQTQVNQLGIKEWQERRN